jgi:hypothetical protein
VVAAVGQAGGIRPHTHPPTPAPALTHCPPPLRQGVVGVALLQGVKTAREAAVQQV